MKPKGTLILTRQEVASLLSLDECIVAVEHAFKLYAEGKTQPPGILGVQVRDGGFHIKAGVLDPGTPYFAAKVNANFPENRQRFGLPTIQGVIVLCDRENGYPLALMDSIEITIKRTGAATAVAAKYLARPDSKVVTICGCGNQGRIQLEALAKVCPLDRVLVFDIDESRARQFADSLARELKPEIVTARNLTEAIRKSDICVTCTTSRQYFLNKDAVMPGTFVAAVGADGSEKQELDPSLMVSNKVVVDILEQCATIGDLHHALEEGLITKANVHAELSEVIAGKKPGRTTEEEITIFDSTGVALQDLAAAALVYEKARNTGRCATLNLAG